MKNSFSSKQPSSNFTSPRYPSSYVIPPPLSHTHTHTHTHTLSLTHSHSAIGSIQTLNSLTGILQLTEKRMKVDGNLKCQWFF